MILCLNCGKITKNPKFCSRSCSAIKSNKLYPKRKLERKCTKCSNIIRNSKSKLCDKHFKEMLSKRIENFENRTLSYYWKKKSLSKLHISSKNAHIRVLCRTKLKHLTKLPCAICNYNKHVELCHIKPVSSFSETSTLSEVNSESNVVQLCRNCHWEFDNGILDIVGILGIQPRS